MALEETAYELREGSLNRIPVADYRFLSPPPPLSPSFSLSVSFSLSLLLGGKEIKPGKGGKKEGETCWFTLSIRYI